MRIGSLTTRIGKRWRDTSPQMRDETEAHPKERDRPMANIHARGHNGDDKRKNLNYLR